MPDAPQGRIGYVITGFNDREPGAGGGKERRCNNCRPTVWFPADSSCPNCGWRGTGFNLNIRRAQLDRNLIGYAHTANSQPTGSSFTSSVREGK